MSLDQRELKWRKPAALLAAFCVVATAYAGFGGPFFGQVALGWGMVFKDVPNNSPAQLIFYHQHSSDLLALSALGVIALFCLSATMLYLDNSVRTRRPQMPRISKVCIVVGPAVMAVCQVIFWILLVNKTNGYVNNGNQTYPEAHKLLTSNALQLPRAPYLAGSMATGFAFVMISINAMRVGLLTRFMGYLGAIAGGMIVIPLIPIPVVLVLWLGAVAYLISGRWPGGVPQAWQDGKAHPWPTVTELRDKRNESVSSS